MLDLARQIDLTNESPSSLFFSDLGKKSYNKVLCTHSKYASQGEQQLDAVKRLKGKSNLHDLEIYDFISYVANEKSETATHVLHSQYFPDGIIRDDILKRFSTDSNLFEESGRLSERKRLLMAELILCPVSIENHWYLMAISKPNDDKRVVIRCLDGLNNLGAHVKIFESGKRLMNELYGLQAKSFEFDMKSAEVLKQNNGYDCGTVVSYYATEFCRDPNLFTEKDSHPGGTCDYSGFRQAMLDNLNDWATTLVREQLQRSLFSIESHPQRLTGPQLTPTRLKAF